MNQQNTSKKWITYLLVFVLIMAMIYVLSSMGTNGEKISYTEFQQKVISNEIAEINVLGDTIRLRKREDGVAKDDFPKKVDFYCTFQSSAELVAFIDQYNAVFLDGDETNDPADREMVLVTYKFEEQSIFEVIVPYLSIGLMIVFGIMLFRAMSGGGSKAFSFGKSKARMVITSKVKFSDVAGADEEKQELQEVVEFLKNPQRFKEVGARIPKGVLLVGPPGTGKTLLGKAVAGEASVPFFTISGSDFVEMYVGVGASRVRDLFDQAKKSAPCIIFIDEIDAVGRQRGAGMGGGNDEREQTLNQLLVEMDGFDPNEGIIVLAATNRADVLDPALQRPGRFDRIIYVRMPDVKGREEIIKLHARNKPFDEEIDFKRLARLTSGFAGADIENLLNEAAILCARDHRVKITMVDITEGINKVLMGPKKKSLQISEQDKRITALHEGGHAIVAMALPNCDKVQEISIVPRGDAGGYTLTLDEDDKNHIGYNRLTDMLTMMLGGRAAEEIMLKDVTTGASNDIKKATQIARKMVTEWGMSKAIGLIGLSTENEVFIGRDYQKQVNFSEQTAAAIDAEVKQIIDTAYAKAKQIINSKLGILKDLIELLLKKETIYSEEFALLYNGKSVNEIISLIEKKEKDDKKRHDKQREEAKTAKVQKEVNARLNTAEALLKAGVITQKDYENVKAEVEKIEKSGQNAAEQKHETQKQTAPKQIKAKTTAKPKATEAKSETKGKKSTAVTKKKTNQNKKDDQNS